MSKTYNKTGGNSNVVAPTLKKYIGDENIKKIQDLFSGVKTGDEFEFIFFSKKGSYLSKEKYVCLLKFLMYMTEKKIYTVSGPSDTLDINFSSDEEIVYRCSITEKDSRIATYMKKLSRGNHVVFRTLVDMWKKKAEGIELMKKEKESGNTIDIDDLNFRVRLSKESSVTKDEVKMLLDLDETNIRKIKYRYKQRTSFYVIGNDSSDEFIRIDLTQTQTANTYTGINENYPKYELEIEYGTKKSSTKDKLDTMFQITEILLKNIQQSNYLITKNISDEVIAFYKNLLSISKQITALDSRQSITLEIQHVTENLANRYAVTDKADGDRNMLIIFNNKIYFISTNLDVRYSGIVLPDNLSEYNGTILDGELIFVPNAVRHIFLIFDCLFHKSIDIRNTIKLMSRIKFADDVVDNCFIFGKQKGYNFDDNAFTLGEKFNLDARIKLHFSEIKKMITALNHDIELEKQYVLVRRKYFISALGAKDWEIFAYATTVWNSYTKNAEIKCPYLLDGLIFQPLEQSYVSNSKESRMQDYKWKPPEKNSVDFYIEFEKDADNKILTVYDNSYDAFVRNKPYRICKLHVGQRVNGVESPVLFREKESLQYAYLFLEDGECRDMDKNIISDKTVVEFYYNNDPEILDRFRWIPIRTRYDKT